MYCLEYVLASLKTFYLKISTKTVLPDAQFDKVVCGLYTE